MKDPRSNVFGRQVTGETHSATAVAAASFIASLMHRARTLIEPRSPERLEPIALRAKSVRQALPLPARSLV